MRIYDLKTNHIYNPLGYGMKEQRLTWAYGDVSDIKDSIWRTVVTVALDEALERIVYQTMPGSSEGTVSCELAFPLEPYTRYYWQVGIKTISGAEAVSGLSWFETVLLL